MFAKIKAGFQVLQVGKEVGNPKLWKRTQDFGNVLGALLLALAALAKAFGYEFALTESDALIVGGGIATAWNVVLNNITSKKVGLLPAEREAERDSHQDNYIG